MKNNALLIVDLQKDFCPGGSLAVRDGDKIVPVINKIIDKFNIVIATKDWHPENSAHFKKWPIHCIENSDGAEFHQDLKTSKIKKIFYKGTSTKDDGYSGFEATNESLEDFLKNNNISTLYICGLALDYCVKATAIDSVNKGFETFIILDATKAVETEKDEIDKIINELKNKGIKFISSTQI